MGKIPVDLTGFEPANLRRNPVLLADLLSFQALVLDQTIRAAISRTDISA